MRFIVYTHLKWKSYIHLSQHLGITWKNTAEVQFGTWNIMKYCGCNPSGNQTWPLKLPWDFPWLFPCSILSELRWILSIVHGQSLEPRVSPWTEMPRSESKGSLKTKKKHEEIGHLYGFHVSKVWNHLMHMNVFKNIQNLGLSLIFLGGKARIDEWFIAIPFDIAIKRCSPFQKPTPILKPECPTQLPIFFLKRSRMFKPTHSKMIHGTPIFNSPKRPTCTTELANCARAAAKAKR